MKIFKHYTRKGSHPANKHKLSIPTLITDKIQTRTTMKYYHNIYHLEWL